ncbi:tyrosine-protein phosphatase [Rhizobium helianthi]|uniref:Tyrosine-protein phosphatase n=1 Tax=Rhizobium helianthi TaxID=1132695 RepID=A0ABW4M3T5_9HYPH
MRLAAIVLKKTGLTMLSLLVALLLWLGYLQLVGNFHEVIPGRLYRSAQLSSQSLGSYLEEYKIKTVINLRGEHIGSPWYDQELATVESHGAREVNFEMSARTPLSIERTFALLDILRHAEGPILIHCRSGADRTGLASVIYLQQIAGIDEETAEWQLSPLFGHLNLPFIKEYAMDSTWEAFEKVIGLDS